MWILDTNHYSEIERNTVIGRALHERLQNSNDPVFVTIITAQEVLKGWLAAINRHHQLDDGVRAYRDFQTSLDGFGDWFLLPWSEDAAFIFNRIRTRNPNKGTLDLRIASIALEHDVTVLTRNLVDFQRVPGLRVENWLD
jgi:tRNA(fMet)-specific endonuclease VapC